MLTPEGRAKLESLFHEASDLPASERSGFLDRACGTEGELRRRVDALLSRLADPEALPFHPMPAQAGGRRRDPRPRSSDLPARLGRFPVVGVLGQGGTSAIYEGVDPLTGESVALKVFRRDAALGLEERWIQEAEVLASLAHPGIVCIRSVHLEHDPPFLVMERVMGESLSETLSRRALTIDESLEIARQVASALEAAHSRGIVHRDLKPSNVMRTPDGLVKLLDFGIAAASVDTERSHFSDRSVLIAGTPGYMSPEQILGESVDARSDLWSFGCVLYECLTSRRLFGGATIDEILLATSNAPIEFQPFSTDWPSALGDLLSRCLVRDRELRLSLAQQARRTLEGLLLHRPDLACAEHQPGERASKIRGSAPQPLTAFVGRTDLIRGIEGLLPRTRILSLVGIGGMGKTRIALEVTERLLRNFDAGAVWIDLALARTRDDAWSRLAEELSIREASSRKVPALVRQVLLEARVLLVLDSCQTVAECGQWVSELARSIPGITFLCTSREPLRADGEVIVNVGPMSVSVQDQRRVAADPAVEPPLAAPAVPEALRLFLARARDAMGRDLLPSEIAGIENTCRRLDGIPLAIEIAAARLPEGDLHVLQSGLITSAPPASSPSSPSADHSAALRSVVRWSSTRLPEAARRLFRRLSVFPGDFGLSAAEEVCGGDGVLAWETLNLVIHLRDRALLETDLTAARRARMARFRMLHAVRAAAAEELLEAGEDRRFEDRYRDYFCLLARTNHTDWIGLTHERWEVVEVEHDGFRAALEACLRAPDALDRALQLAEVLGRYWNDSGRWSEGRPLLERVLGMEGTRAFPLARGQVFLWAALLARNQGDYAHARGCFESKLELDMSIGDPSQIACTLRELAGVAYYQADFDTASSLVHRALSIYRTLGQTPEGALGTAHCLSNLAALDREAGLLEAAIARFEESIRLYRDHGSDREVARAQTSLGFLLTDVRRFDEADSCFAECIRLRRGFGDVKGLTFALRGAGSLAHERGDYARARQTFLEGMALSRDAADLWGIMAYLDDVADLYGSLGEFRRAARLTGAVESLRRLLDAPRSPRAVEAERGRAERLRRELGEETMTAERDAGSQLDWRAAIECAEAPLGTYDPR